MGEGVVLSTGQIIAAIGTLVTLVGTLLRIIQTQYKDRIAALEAQVTNTTTECDKRMGDQTRSHDQRVADILDSHKRTTERLDARIAWLEERDSRWRDQQSEYIKTLENSAEIQQRQTDAIMALTETKSTNSRTRRS